MSCHEHHTSCQIREMRILWLYKVVRNAKGWTKLLEFLSAERH